MSESYPHGECECRQGCQCEGIAGPAAFELNRGKSTLKVCTRCTLPGDRDRKLLPTGDTLLQPYADWDSLGLLVILLTLEKESAPQEKS